MKLALALVALAVALGFTVTTILYFTGLTTKTARTELGKVATARNTGQWK